MCLFLSLSFVSYTQRINPALGDGFWTQVSTMRMNQIIWMNDTLYASRNPLYQSNGGIYRSVDDGMNWDTLYSVSDVTSSGLRLFIHPTNHRILYLIYGALYKSTNGGQTWNTIFGSFGPLVRLGINPKNPNIMYVTKSIPYGAVFKTTDGGNIWNDVSNGLPNEEYFQAGPIDVNPLYPDTILVGTNTGVYRSTNGGTNWDTTIVKGFIPGINIHPSRPNIVFASTTYDWSTYKTTDYDAAWYKTLGSYGASKYVFSSTFDSIIYSSENLKSNNFGDSWFKIDTIYSGWADLAINTSYNPTIFGINITYGLYKLTDMISTIDDASQLNNFLTTSNFPNPFNSTTRIQVEIPQQSFVSIIIYNSLGQRVNILLDKTELQAGKHFYNWNGRDVNGVSVATGIYFCNLFIGHSEKTESQTSKLVLLK